MKEEFFYSSIEIEKHKKFNLLCNFLKNKIQVKTKEGELNLKENKPKISYKDITKTNPHEIQLIVCPLSLDTFNNKLEITRILKNIYPESYIMASKKMQDGKLKLGELYCFEENRRIIANIPVRRRFTDKISPRTIKDGLNELKKHLIQHTEITTIGIPQFAPWFSIDDTQWDDLKPTILRTIIDVDPIVKITIFEKMP